MALRFVVGRHRGIDDGSGVDSAGDAGTVGRRTFKVHVASTEDAL